MPPRYFNIFCCKQGKIGHGYETQYFQLKGLSSTNIKAELDSTQEE